MNASDALRYAAAFGVAGKSAVELHGGYSNECWLVRDPADDAFVVRRYGRLHVTRNALFYEHAAMRHAALRGAGVRAPLENADGESFALIDGAFVAAIPYVAGQTGDRAGFWEAGALLATFHIAMRDFRARRPRVTRTLGVLGWLRERFVRMASDPLLARALDWNAAIAAVGSAASRIAPHTARLPLAVVHGDAHPENVVTADGLARALIDFDFAHETERAYDVATLADSYARSNDDAPLDVARFAAVAEAYAVVAPLTIEERAALFDFAVRRNAMLVWYLSVRHGERTPGDVGRAPRYVERLVECERFARAENKLRAAS